MGPTAKQFGCCFSANSTGLMQSIMCKKIIHPSCISNHDGIDYNIWRLKSIFNMGYRVPVYQDLKQDQILQLAVSD